MDLLGFDLDDFQISDLTEEQSEAKEDDYEEPVPKVPRTKSGDIYKLGEHRLMCGDSTNIEDVKLLMSGNLADLLITDPPYNVNYHGGTAQQLTIKNDSTEMCCLFFCLFLHKERW